VKILETKRLILRHLLPEDLDDLFALYRDPEIRRYFPEGTLTYEETKEELEWFLNGHPDHPELGLWATILKENGRFIGRCGLLPWTLERRPEVEVAYLLAKEYWRQGLGSEAAQAIVHYAYEQLGLTRLICMIDLGNEGSMKVARNIGMSLERETEDEEGPFLLYSMSLPRPEAGEAWQVGEITAEEAASVLAWRYAGEDAFYNTQADAELAAEFAEPALWRLRDLERERDVLLAARDARGGFVGFFAFKGSRDRCEIGLGLAPELTGCSLGLAFVRAGLSFARRQWGVTRFCLEVAAFNRRALTVYERLGFVESGRVSRAAPELGGEMVEFIEMTLGPTEG
jgi:ribosomal-protein-alanine N-acetyltransferase